MRRMKQEMLMLVMIDDDEHMMSFAWIEIVEWKLISLSKYEQIVSLVPDETVCGDQRDQEQRK